MKRAILINAMLTLMLTGVLAEADDDNELPSFFFGNHIDTHQETTLKINNAGEPKKITGNFLIYFTGVTDPASGLPIARHPRGASHDEVCESDDDKGYKGYKGDNGDNGIDCVAGWVMKGRPGAARFVSQSGVNGDDHPVWLVNREPGQLLTEVSAIPQPGPWTHFHWITTTSNDPRASSVLAECDKEKAGQMQNTAPSAVNAVCPGWFLKIRAVRDFAFLHGGEVIPVRTGRDNRSHLNIVTNYELEPVLPAGSITPTR